MTLRIVLADDQAVIRAGLRMIIDNEPDMRVIAEAGTGHEAVEAVTVRKPDVVLMDIRMPDLDGIEATRRIASQGGPPVLVLTTFGDEENVFGSLRAGAAGFLLKDAEPDTLLSAIRTVSAGESLVDPSVTRALIDRWVALEEAMPAAKGVDDLGLTDRETEVWRMIARGLSNKEIGDELYLSEATVKTHVSSLLAKLGARSRVQAVILAYEHGVVRIGDSAG
ncbi:MAG: response regulator transcription factor [Actinomycetes bacterium]|nr:MAG: DNA-binding response regulator [Actinomycetota bacterium]